MNLYQKGALIGVMSIGLSLSVACSSQKALIQSSNVKLNMVVENNLTSIDLNSLELPSNVPEFAEGVKVVTNQGKFDARIINGVMEINENFSNSLKIDKIYQETTSYLPIELNNLSEANDREMLISFKPNNENTFLVLLKLPNGDVMKPTHNPTKGEYEWLVPDVLIDFQDMHFEVYNKLEVVSNDK